MNWIRHFHVVVRQCQQRKMRAARAELLLRQSKPKALLPFSLTSPSSLLQFLNLIPNRRVANDSLGGTVGAHVRISPFHSYWLLPWQQRQLFLAASCSAGSRLNLDQPCVERLSLEAAYWLTPWSLKHSVRGWVPPTNSQEDSFQQAVSNSSFK